MSQCGRCGSNHHAGVCRAINARCLKCYMFGHFARVCRTNTKARSPALQVQRKKQRDTERMTAFLRKKDAENLPFSSLLNDELLHLCFNSLLRLKTECGHKCKKEKQDLQEKVGGFEASVSFLRVENGEIKTTIKTTEDEAQQIKKENKEIKSASRRKDNRIKQFISESEKTSAKIERLEREKVELRVELGKRARAISELELKNISIQKGFNNHLAMMDRVVAETKDVVEKERQQYAESIQKMKATHKDLKETNECQHAIIQKCKHDISELSDLVSHLDGARHVRNFNCRKCGGTNFHEGHRCPASVVNSFCMYCNRGNHFSIFCKDCPIC